jgi:hypothetical protein
MTINMAKYAEVSTPKFTARVFTTGTVTNLKAKVQYGITSNDIHDIATECDVAIRELNRLWEEYEGT